MLCTVDTRTHTNTHMLSSKIRVIRNEEILNLEKIFEYISCPNTQMDIEISCQKKNPRKTVIFAVHKVSKQDLFI